MRAATALRVGYLFNTETLLSLFSLLGVPSFLPTKEKKTDTEELMNQGYASRAADGRVIVEIELAFLIESLALNLSCCQWEDGNDGCVTVCLSKDIWILCRKTQTGKWEICPMQDESQAADEIDKALQVVGEQAHFSCRFLQAKRPCNGKECIELLKGLSVSPSEALRETEKSAVSPPRR